MLLAAELQLGFLYAQICKACGCQSIGEGIDGNINISVLADQSAVKLAQVLNDDVDGAYLGLTTYVNALYKDTHTGKQGERWIFLITVLLSHYHTHFRDAGMTQN